jgi:hypothetical protein
MNDILNNIMADNSRLFGILDSYVSWETLKHCIKSRKDVVPLAIVGQYPDSRWFDFFYKDHEISINNQGNEYLFFVSDCNCPVNILSELWLFCKGL